MLNVERRFDDGAIVTGIAVVALLARRVDFTRRGDPTARWRVGWHAVVLAGTIAVYGIVTLWINRLMADQPYTLTFALRVTGRAASGLGLRGVESLNGPIANWFPLSVFLLTVGSLGLVLVEWLAPWRYRLQQRATEFDRVRDLVRTWGADTLAPFALRADKSYFFAADESAFVAYRVIGGVAIVSGDPVGREDARAEAIRMFLPFARERGWRVAVLGASEEYLGLYRSLGLRALYHGDEAVVDTRTFSLEGRPIRKVRQSVHRLERAGFTARVLMPGEIDAELAGELEAIARAWRGDAPERGFVMALDTLFGAGDGAALFVVGLDAEERPQGFLHFATCPAGGALSLSSMPRAPRGAERLRRVAHLRVARVGAGPRHRERVAQLLAVCGAPVAGRGVEHRPARAGGDAACTEGQIPARQPSALQPEVLSELAATVRHLREPPRLVAHRRGRIGRRGVPSLSVTALGFGLAVVSRWRSAAAMPSSTKPRRSYRR